MCKLLPCVAADTQFMEVIQQKARDITQARTNVMLNGAPAGGEEGEVMEA